MSLLQGSWAAPAEASPSDDGCGGCRRAASMKKFYQTLLETRRVRPPPRIHYSCKRHSAAQLCSSMHFFPPPIVAYRSGLQSPSLFNPPPPPNTPSPDTSTLQVWGRTSLWSPLCYAGAYRPDWDHHSDQSGSIHAFAPSTKRRTHTHAEDFVAKFVQKLSKYFQNVDDKHNRHTTALRFRVTVPLKLVLVSCNKITLEGQTMWRFVSIVATALVISGRASVSLFWCTFVKYRLLLYDSSTDEEARTTLWFHPDIDSPSLYVATATPCFVSFLYLLLPSPFFKQPGSGTLPISPPADGTSAASGWKHTESAFLLSFLVPLQETRWGENQVHVSDHS